MRRPDCTIQRAPRHRTLWLKALLPFVFSLCACKGSGDGQPIPPVAQVDLPRYMGDWYVIASIPSFMERQAFDAVESYALRPDGKVQTTFRYRDGSHDAEVKTMYPVGTVKPGANNAVWGMQFIWPIQAEYIIAYLDKDYSQTIVARNARDYVWIMARSPAISEADYQAHLTRIRALGYDISKIRKVPQQTVPVP